MAEWTNTILQGLLLGGLYAMFATGLSLTFGIMRIVNVAHGDMIIVSAYMAFWLVETFGIDPFLSLAIVIPVMAVLGYALQRSMLSRALSGGILVPLMVTYGLSVILQNVLMELFSANSRAMRVEGLDTASLSLGAGIAVGVYPLIVMCTAIAVIFALQLVFAKTPLGRSFRATSDDQSTAQLMGIDNRKVYALAMALSFAIVALAGVYLGMRTTFDPTAGPSRLLYAFEAVVIGGLGSLWGTLAGGMVLGVSQAIGFRLDPGWGVLSSHLAFLVILVLRPRGLFPRMRER